jgi:nucleoside-diphosphate-sugar epimerase
LIAARVCRRTSQTIDTEIQTTAKLNQSFDLAIPKGSRVLVAGTTGYFATHTIHEFFVLGYKVKKSARYTQKADHTRKLFVQHGSSNYDRTVVLNIAIDRAFGETVKGASTVVHSASVISFDKDPNKVIPITVVRVTTVLKGRREKRRMSSDSSTRYPP